MLTETKTCEYLVDSEDKLRSLYPGTRFLAVLDELDRTAIKFIEHSPFVVIAACNPDIGIEVSPRGDAPGFVKVLNPHTLVIPDRSGNHRLDCMTGLLKHREIGLMFLAPGLLECLRVKGEASITHDPAVLELFRERNGKLPRTAIVVNVYESFIHCGKAINRGHLWDNSYTVSQETWKLMRGTLENAESSALDLDE
ncbi:pyridoxamine 5'-phosphate oxidase family protein [Paucibacter sp. APW11]|uniref:Pyridoxamine 5'-phosphate oxidase family protein n=1 Tax=Roseateles aquae TaxID=3077235 RepID=A0ABU3PAT6_9BURK|nr:MSMEG_1061 family FMN-dependent PPOX-type flavoprotein [Paucibacter sp. APW11]MDT8999694.1 pyridoxamine 5'-phosphate oxidase family protein [Paucibacter sp. APW11]